MRSLLVFLKKEMTEQIRSGRLLLLGIIFVLLGIMNPAIAKITPWLLETLSDSLAESGMSITGVSVSAMDSWVQFFKNAPIGLIVFVLLQSNIFTGEYASGTLVLSLTKGLARYKVVIAKALVLLVLWSAGYWLSFGITYAYNAYFWDNAVAENLGLSVVCWWIFGVLTVALMTLFSTLLASGTGVLLGTGGVVLLSCLLGLAPRINEFLPTRLTDGNSLIYGTAGAGDYTAAIAITAALSIACLLASLPLFAKKHL